MIELKSSTLSDWLLPATGSVAIGGGFSQVWGVKKHASLQAQKKQQRILHRISFYWSHGLFRAGYA